MIDEAKLWRYSAFGLTVEADRPLPELDARRSLQGGGPSLSIRVQIGAPCIEASDADGDYVRELTPDRVIIHDSRYGWLIMTPGRIRVLLYSGEYWESMRTYVVGTALGVALYQLGYVPLHASAVCWEGSAVAFTGASGAGKSTMAAACVLHAGAKLLCDDTAVLGQGPNGRVTVWPGAARNRLCGDVLRPLGLDPQFESAPGQKLSIASIRPAVEVPQLCALLTISVDGAKPAGTVDRLPGIEAAQAWLDAVYRPEYGLRIIGRGNLHRWVLDHCGLVPVYRLYRSPVVTHLRESVETFQNIWPKLMERR